MDLIDQQLVVKDWPLKNPGDEAFFGYVVAVGVFPRDWNAESLFAYVDFAYNESYTRYRLPHDEGLRTQLLQYLVTNLETLEGSGEVYGKVCVSLTDQGYEVSLP